MFNQKKAKPENIRYLKDVISKELELPETTILSIAELSCHEPGCPPKETVITSNASVSYTHLTLPTICSV